MRSVADTCIIPVQDYLGFGSEARINTPSTLGDNWKWRMSKNAFSDALKGENLAYDKIVRQIIGKQKGRNDYGIQRSKAEELQFNPFTKIGKEWMLITAGTEEKCNTMTASWGGVGVISGEGCGDRLYPSPALYQRICGCK